jgi:hypothetical protein
MNNLPTSNLLTVHHPAPILAYVSDPVLSERNDPAMIGNATQISAAWITTNIGADAFTANQ